VSAALVVGALLLAAGACLAAVRGLQRPGLVVQALGAALVGIAGAWAVIGGETAGSAFTGALELRVGVDPLSGVFLLALGMVAAPALVHATGYLRPDAAGRTIATLTGAFVLALVGVVTARDPLGFLAWWELMTLLPAAIVLAAHAQRAARRAVFVYVAITHLGGTGVWVAVLLLADAGVLDGETLETGSGLQAAIAVAAIVGFGTKAGVMPLHAWLPRAHPIAPAPVSALMSAVLVSVALYGLVRVLVEWLGTPPLWVGASVVALGALSTVGGIVYALFQHDLKRLLAFSTIDNVGIVLLAVGACLILRADGADDAAALAVAAGLLHVLTHAGAKGALFLAAGSIERATGTTELDQLGGLLRRLPWTGGALLVAAAAIAGVPPLGGFASEWLTLQALLRVPAEAGAAGGVVAAVALGALGAAAAMAVYCFVKVVGTILLGPTDRPACVRAVEVPRSMALATVGLAGTTVLLGLASGPLYGRLLSAAAWSDAQPATVGLELPATGGLPLPGFALVLGGLTLGLALLRGSRRAAPAPTWACGQPVGPELDWTGAGFTKSLRLVLEPLLRPERELAVERRGGLVLRTAYRGRVPQLIDERLYRPVTAFALTLAASARRLQSGRLGTYVAYLVGLVVVLLLAVELGAIG
jgi:formate hydrogenlyase subunit 3/multisubunit Na+/H+ antiporter MnhD subunit